MGIYQCLVSVAGGPAFDLVGSTQQWGCPVVRGGLAQPLHHPELRLPHPLRFSRGGISQIWIRLIRKLARPLVHVVVMQQTATWRRANESFAGGATRAVESNSARVCASLDERRRPGENVETGRKRNQATGEVRLFRNSLTQRNKALVVAGKRSCANFSILTTTKVGPG